MTDPINPAPAPTNRPPRSRPMHAGEHWLDAHWYEARREDPACPEVYAYTDRMSYAPGEEVRSPASTTAPQWSLRIDRDGLEPRLVHAADDLPGRFTPAPKDAYKAGCGWPVLHAWRLP